MLAFRTFTFGKMRNRPLSRRYSAPEMWRNTNLGLNGAVVLSALLAVLSSTMTPFSMTASCCSNASRVIASPYFIAHHRTQHHHTQA